MPPLPLEQRDDGFHIYALLRDYTRR